MASEEPDHLAQWDSTCHFSDIARQHYSLFQQEKSKADAILSSTATSEDEATLKTMNAYPHVTAMKRHVRAARADNRATGW
jgi:hypothetical protein